jgi:prepilin-type N-terminal cleavage/methylation domain-containing protein
MMKTRGFTLIELLVVIIIIGMLLAIVRPMLSSSAARTRLLQCESNLRHVSVAMQAYVQDYEAFPKKLSDLDSALQDKSLVICPGTSKQYYYRAPGPNAARDEIVAGCVNPDSRRARWPHCQGTRCLSLTAGGAVRKNRRP